MKVPITASILIATSAAAFTALLWGVSLTEFERLTLAIATWAAAGALTSACFVVWGYLDSQKALIESQMPRLQLFVTNKGPASGDHWTIINYINKGSVDCEDLTLWAELVNEEVSFPLVGLFDGPYTMQVCDSRCRSFPTRRELPQYGVPADVLKDLANFRLRVGYRVKSLKGWVSKEFMYRWQSGGDGWFIL